MRRLVTPVQVQVAQPWRERTPERAPVMMEPVTMQTMSCGPQRGRPGRPTVIVPHGVVRSYTGGSVQTLPAGLTPGGSFSIPGCATGAPYVVMRPMRSASTTAPGSQVLTAVTSPAVTSVTTPSSVQPTFATPVISPLPSIQASAVTAAVDSQIASLSVTIARREAQIKLLENELQKTSAELSERDGHIARLRQQNAQLQNAQLQGKPQEPQPVSGGRVAGQRLRESVAPAAPPPQERARPSAGRKDALGSSRASSSVARATSTSARRASSAEQRRSPSVSSEWRQDAGDTIDQRLRDYFDAHPDFAVEVEKVKPGWYIFGSPIGKKVYIRMARDTAVVKVGGGYKVLGGFFDEYRCDADELPPGSERHDFERRSLSRTTGLRRPNGT